MFGQEAKVESSLYEAATKQLLSELITYGPEAPEYPKMLSYLELLAELKTNHRSKRRVSPDTMAIVIGNVAGILIIVSYEHAHVMVSKATGFLLKAK